MSHQKKLDTPRQINFPDGISGPRPVFKWHPVHGALNYRVSLKNLQSGATLFFYDIKETTWRSTSEIPPGQYKWYVKAVFSGEEIVSRGQSLKIYSEDDLQKAIYDLTVDKNIRKNQHIKFTSTGTNLTYAANRTLKNKEVENRICELESYPSSIIVNLGHNCNVGCIMCNDGKKADRRSLQGCFVEDLDCYIKYLDHLLISGGEPLLYRKYLKEIINKAANYPNAKIGLHTSGQLIDKEWAKLFCSGLFGNVCISIDGATVKTYESIITAASFQKVINSLKLVANYNQDEILKVTLTFVVMKRNYHEILDYIVIGKRYGVKEIVFQPVRTQALPELESENILYDVDLCKEILQRFKDVRGKCAEYGINLVDKVTPFIFNTHPELIENSDELKFLPDYILETGMEEDIKERVRSLFLQTPPNPDARKVVPKIDPDSFKESRNNRFFCRLPFENLYVNVEESMVCCNSLRNFYYIPFGTTWKYLHDIWNSSLHQEARQLMLENKASTHVCHPVCAFYHKGGYQRGRDQYLWV
jgi:uncharacterized Fe-S cluster-containing radical SAM superfamily protein